MLYVVLTFKLIYNMNSSKIRMLLMKKYIIVCMYIVKNSLLFIHNRHIHDVENSIIKQLLAHELQFYKNYHS